MTLSSRFYYYLAQKQDLIDSKNSIFKSFLPASRCFAKDSLKNKAEEKITYGDYFHCVRDFLEKNKHENIRRAVFQRTGYEIPSEKIESISVFLVKHGAFYHPSRIEVVIDGRIFQFVLNVAVSTHGKKNLKQEFNYLKKLNESYPFDFIPKVYCHGKEDLKNGRTIRMFLGQWFEGYSEFHISKDPSDDRKKIVLWDENNPAFFLNPDQALELYRMAAMILTSYFNPVTLEQIFPWHHAAGDFIVGFPNGKLDVKLITVRNYTPIFKDSNVKESIDMDAVKILNAVSIFFFNMSIRMRMDRLDGTQDLVWAEKTALIGTIEGFFQGLDLVSGMFSIPEPFLDFIKAHFSSRSYTEWFDLGKALQNTYNPAAPEIPIITDNLKTHVTELCELLK